MVAAGELENSPIKPGRAGGKPLTRLTPHPPLRGTFSPAGRRAFRAATPAKSPRPAGERVRVRGNREAVYGKSVPDNKRERFIAG